MQNPLPATLYTNPPLAPLSAPSASTEASHLVSPPTGHLASLAIDKVPLTGPAPVRDLSLPSPMVPSTLSSDPPMVSPKALVGQAGAHKGMTSSAGRSVGAPPPRAETTDYWKSTRNERYGTKQREKGQADRWNGSRKRSNPTPSQPGHKSQRGAARVSRRPRTEDKPRSFPCDTCGKVFHRKYNLLAHELMHDPSHPRPFICPADACKKAFARKYDACRHYRQIHCRHEGMPQEWIHHIVDTRRV